MPAYVPTWPTPLYFPTGPTPLPPKPKPPKDGG